jgi:hypothetical protein
MRLPKAVQHWDDERDAGNGIIVMLKSGYKWSFDGHGLHVRGYDTPKEARLEFRDIEACPCEVCK